MAKACARRSRLFDLRDGEHSTTDLTRLRGPATGPRRESHVRRTKHSNPPITPRLRSNPRYSRGAVSALVLNRHKLAFRSKPTTGVLDEACVAPFSEEPLSEFPISFLTIRCANQHHREWACLSLGKPQVATHNSFSSIDGCSIDAFADTKPEARWIKAQGSSKATTREGC